MVSFSSEYYQAAQKVMVRDDGKITSIVISRGKRGLCDEGLHVDSQHPEAHARRDPSSP